MKALIALSRGLGAIALVSLASAVSAAAAVDPLLSLSLRGVRDGRVTPGEPVGVAVRLSVPARSTAAIVIAPERGGWTDAISIELAREVGDRAVAAGAVMGKPDTPRITVEAKSAVGGVWLISSAAMQAVPPGNYVVRAQLNVDSGSGWKGRVRSAPLRLTVVPVSTEAARAAQRAAALAFEAVAANRPEAAAGLLDAQLKLTPDDRSLLLLRAAIAEHAGNETAALALVNRAARGVSPQAPPPADLHAAQARLQAKLLAPPTPGAAPAPPAWSALPAFLLPTVTPEMMRASKPAVAATTTAPVMTPPVAGAGAPMATAPVTVTIPTSSGRVGAPAAGQVVPTGELNEAAILADAAGQWAATARAKTSYSNPSYGPGKATGAPDVPVAGNSPDAWCPATRQGGLDWLEVTFAQPVRATGVRVRQNDTAGAIVKVEAFEPDGTSHVWWDGVDPYRAPVVRTIAWFALRVPPTEYAVSRVKITLNLDAGSGYKQIDAVQLVAVPAP
ncbi:hypothetical protein [Horticoccus sp. 23ND18S-11]|uniref:hypothetical protein n=1 Tax=Horticoccus sp. 23ND18S-11 TaxID=3391832 RepID=UPI0039C9D92F